ncbi:MAG: hypothetical protein JJD92_15060 [Frankiaceae bacterium]|nr:hypothetical protein [Frankiaceae bacterium]
MYPEGPYDPPSAYRPYRAPVTTVPDEVPVAQAGFVDDVRAALGVWRRFPALPLLTTLFAVIAAAASSTWAGAPLAGLIAVFFLAWVGSERLWYLRAFTGRTLSPGAAVRASFAYWGRFFCLFLWVGVLTIPLWVPAMVYGGYFDKDVIEGDGDIALWAIVYLAVGTLITDFLLTFVTPAIVYNSRRARTAIGIGLRLLRRTWPHAALYVVFPPLAVLLLTRFSTGPVGWGGAALIVVSSLVNLVAKGATAAYYLRVMPITEPDGDIDLR